MVLSLMLVLQQDISPVEGHLVVPAFETVLVLENNQGKVGFSATHLYSVGEARSKVHAYATTRVRLKALDEAARRSLAGVLKDGVYEYRSDARTSLPIFEDDRVKHYQVSYEGNDFRKSGIRILFHIAPIGKHILGVLGKLGEIKINRLEDVLIGEKSQLIPKTKIRSAEGRLWGQCKTWLASAWGRIHPRALIR